MSALKYWVWLSLRRGIGPAAGAELLKKMGTPEAVFFASREDYRLNGISERDADVLMDKGLSRVSETLDSCIAHGYRILTLNDAEYPERLANIYDPPIVLYVRGRFPVMDEEAAVAVVGTRKCSPYGIRMAERFGYELAREGCVVVSGMARGVDTAAAHGALRGGGSVIGVIGSGPDVVYPPENEELFEDVAQCGAIISEYAPGTAPDRRHFPVRNRILSGLSLGTLVVEAPEHSGALITAARALEQGRDVFVIPANVDSEKSLGSNRLLRAGAIPVLSGADVADEYRSLYPDKLSGNAGLVPLEEKAEEKLIAENLPAEKTKRVPVENQKNSIDNKKDTVYDKQESRNGPELTEEERAVFSAMGEECLHVNDIIEKSGLPGGRVLALLTVLEIRGIVEQKPGKRFQRKG